MSRPVRARGLKLGTGFGVSISSVSRPVRARGLKLNRRRSNRPDMEVAPRAGAWIETALLGLCTRTVYVAPRAGAWIETLHKTRPAGAGIVAPRAGAWIETKSLKKTSKVLQASRPVRARGLKRIFFVEIS